jgi:uncharacterized membrane protein required for colicin V production
MIAAVTQSFSLDNLPVNWFDAALLIILAFGIFRGRKNGMTKEVVPTIEWVVLVAAAGLGYTFVAQFYSGVCGLGKAWSASLGYASIAVLVLIIFSFIKKALMPRLEGSDFFGSAEYYLGMPSGMIRYASVVIFFLALINGPYYSPAELAQQKAYRERWYGGGIYSGDYVPDFHSVQDAVFTKSFSGPYIKQYAGILLVETSPEGGGKDNGKATETASAPKQPQPVIHIGN